MFLALGDYYVVINSNAPVVQGGVITFSAKLRISGSHKEPEGTFIFEWKDNALRPHTRSVGY